MDWIAHLARATGAAGMCGGQAMDMRATGRRIDLDALGRLHAGKTGALIRAAVRMGALAGTNDTAVLQPRVGPLHDAVHLDGVAFRDPSRLDIVGIYPNYAAAERAWRGKAQQTVDNAMMRYFTELRDAGVAVLFVSEELDELTGLRQRVVIEDREKKLHPHIEIWQSKGGKEKRVRDFILSQQTA